MKQIPRIKNVKTKGQTKLSVIFENGVEKIYDCARLLCRQQFNQLTNLAFFRAVRVDPGGYGISWNDDIDLSEYELWTNGKTFANK